MSKRLQWRRRVLIVIWIVVLIHFLKDITQDILHLATFLDVFGNIQEDVHRLPDWVQKIVYGAGVISFLAEIFLLIAIPIARRKIQFSRLERWIVGVIVFMLIYFLTVLLLDPNIFF